jgi:hypothetical protein
MKVELTATILFRTKYLIETIAPVNTHQTNHRQKIRTPTPAERFKSSGLKFLISCQALPPSTKSENIYIWYLSPTSTGYLTPYRNGHKHNLHFHKESMSCSHNHEVRHFLLHNLHNLSYHHHRHRMSQTVISYIYHNCLTNRRSARVINTSPFL